MLDVSDFAAAGSSLVVRDNLWYGIVTEQGTAWYPYTGPLTQMPPLDAGASVEIAFRLSAVPTPMAAGTYGTSFTVVA